MTQRKLISLVLPVYNEEPNIEPLYETLSPILNSLSQNYEFELLFTDNHSTDGTLNKLQALAVKDRRVRVLSFSRNFGFQKSILTGYINARGSAAIQLDCDLQDPPALIPEFLRLWEAGYKVVYGIRRSRQEGFLIHTARRAFYRLIDFLSEEDLPLDSGDFRLIDRQILDLLRQIDDRSPYLRGIIASLGFLQIGVKYDRHLRKLGQSKFNLRRLLGLAVDGIVSHSIVPLRLATYIGLLAAVLTLIGIGVYVSEHLFFGAKWPPGFATTTVLLLLSIALNGLFLGIIGEYIARIYLQVKRGPLTIIERMIPEKSCVDDR